MHFDYPIFNVGAGNNLRVRLEARVDMREDEDVAEDKVSITKFIQSNNQ